ncbi:succinyl-coa ligase alpha chain [Plakobranchus ocellatus]|uniref:Succinyl-coa ligase alpha chain n=1 Tax=Plakobranchus ocellatus TaxID=259542 RepID=A0AAV3XZA8_9GAST|nr:succinyl-coa ligase alpha chain [Plakobranchus ocellatus]
MWHQQKNILFKSNCKKCALQVMIKAHFDFTYTHTLFFTKTTFNVQCLSFINLQKCPSPPVTKQEGVGGKVDSESTMQGPFCRGFKPRYRRPGLTEGLKA